MKKINSFFLALLIACCFACKDEWEPPVLYTVNLSLYNVPDSVDSNNVYYFSDGMKLRIRLNIVSNGEIMVDQTWKSFDNYHWEENSKDISITGSVVNLSNDTALKISNYPVMMRVYKDLEILYDDKGVENKFSF